MHYVLIVDDHADIRRLLSITLGKQYEIIEADNGTAALYAIRRYQPKVVLLDVMMPGEVDVTTDALHRRFGLGGIFGR